MAPNLIIINAVGKFAEENFISHLTSFTFCAKIITVAYESVCVFPALTVTRKARVGLFPEVTL